jgi:hypothetical protein
MRTLLLWNSALTTALSATPVSASVSERSVEIKIPAHSNKVEPVVPTFKTESPRIVRACAVEHWTPQDDARFKELLRNEALRDLSTVELAELESLTRRRRIEKNPRSADEILWQRRQQSLTRNLVRALRAYVDFHQAPDYS